ncbi:MAG: hypothetical protein GXP22_06415 [Gammaproteobacteria bacterium]|nr:hypothetical protein [Gammaproteobacteria bacterium]
MLPNVFNNACRNLSIIIVSVITLISAPPVEAVLYNVSAPASVAGIGFTGVVDTTTDIFTLTSVTDGVLYQDFWTIPSSLTMPAYDSSGGFYDVPDNWNGTIDSTWGFVGPLLSAITFNEGSANGAYSDWTTGWGALINPLGTYVTSPTESNAMSNWPYTSTNGNGYWITQPGHGLLAVTAASVPLPGSAILFISGLLGIIGRKAV